MQRSSLPKLVRPGPSGTIPAGACQAAVSTRNRHAIRLQHAAISTGAVFSQRRTQCRDSGAAFARQMDSMFVKDRDASNPSITRDGNDDVRCG
jgi:hypothetical protein